MTLMKTLLNLQEPISGQILVGDGLKANEIGYLPQQTIVQRDFPASVKQVYLRDLNNLSKVTLFKTLEKLVIDMKNNHKELSIIYLGKRKDFEKVEKRVFYYDYVVTCLDGDVPLKANRCGF